MAKKAIKKTDKKDEPKQAPYLFKFKSEEIKNNFLVHAINNKTTLQEMLTKALKLKYRKIEQ